MLSNTQHITIEDDNGRVLAAADVQAEPEVVRAALRAEAGHLPPGTRARLVDAVLDIPNAEPGTRLEVSLPAGDAEMLQRIRERCEQVQTRAAGASCLLNTTQPRR
jgi:hypothetical protein